MFFMSEQEDKSLNKKEKFFNRDLLMYCEFKIKNISKSNHNELIKKYV
jgi:hypothetical protein